MHDLIFIFGSSIKAAKYPVQFEVLFKNLIFKSLILLKTLKKMSKLSKKTNFSNYFNFVYNNCTYPGNG